MRLKSYGYSVAGGGVIPIKCMDIPTVYHKAGTVIR